MERLQLTEQQKCFFQTFGFLALPGLIKDCIDEVIDAFEEVWQERGRGPNGQVHEGKERSMSVQFIDQHERLCALLDDPRIEGLVGSLIGEAFNFAGSDGNYYVGDTGWHSDRWVEGFKFVKVAFYLDSLRRDSGALRVIPGSHNLHDHYSVQVQDDIGEAEERWGVAGDEVPALVLETEPGDVVVFIHNLKHASFGGGTRRRMFTINCCQHASAETMPFLKECISAHVAYGVDCMYGEKMLATAGPGRRIHLDQVLANQGHMAGEAAQWRAEQTKKGGS